MKRFGTHWATSIAALTFLFALATPALVAPAALGAPPAARRASGVAESFAPAGPHAAAARASAAAARRVGTSAARAGRAPVVGTGHGHAGRIPPTRVYRVYYRSGPDGRWIVYGRYYRASEARAAVLYFRSRGHDAFER
jgi:hypothetical protein